MKRVLLFSGGVDSTTRLYELLTSEPSSDLIAMSVFDSIQWNGEHSPELTAASVFAKKLGVRHIKHDISRTRELFAAIPQGAFTAGGKMGGCCSRNQEYAPMSVSTMLLAACTLAASEESPVLEWALNADDVPEKKDREKISQLVDAVEAMVKAEGYRVRLHLPYLEYSKQEVVSLAQSLGVPLAQTMSCLDVSADGTPCGVCQQCISCQQAISSSSRVVQAA